MSPKKRPNSVTVIGWINIISGGLSLISMIFPATEEAQILLDATGRTGAIFTLMRILSSVIYFISGIAMLKGLNWGRLLYLYSVPTWIVFSGIIYLFSPMLVIAIIPYIIILMFLTRPKALAFFKNGTDAIIENETLTESRPEKQTKKLRKISSVLLLIIGGFILFPNMMMLSVLISEGFDIKAIGDTPTIVRCIILVAINIALIIAGVALNEWSRWRFILGNLFTVVGSFLAFLAVTIPLVMLSPEWKLLGAPKAHVDIKAFIVNLILSALLPLVMGISLLVKQNKLDKVFCLLPRKTRY